MLRNLSEATEVIRGRSGSDTGSLVPDRSFELLSILSCKSARIGFLCLQLWTWILELVSKGSRYTLLWMLPLSAGNRHYWNDATNEYIITNVAKSGKDHSPLEFITHIPDLEWRSWKVSLSKWHFNGDQNMWLDEDGMDLWSMQVEPSRGSHRCRSSEAGGMGS